MGTRGFLLLMLSSAVLACGDNWTENPETGECYHIELVKGLNFFMAQEYCQGLNYSDGESQPDLVSIYSVQEQEFVFSLVSPLHPNKFAMWIGMLNTESGNTWTDGTPSAYTNFHDGEPNDYVTEECINIYVFDGKWNDYTCAEEQGFICEKKGTNYVGPQPPPPPAPVCPDSWVYNNGKCYYVSDAEATADEGLVKCQEVNTKASLVSIHSEEENEFFKEQISENGGSCWLGLQSNGIEWGWADGSEIDYTNWDNGEPVQNKLCGMMVGASEVAHGTWRSEDCSTVQTYSCELNYTDIVGCKDGWSAFGDYCYWNSYSPDDIRLPHNEAQQYCESLGANLVSIHSAEENYFVADLTYASYTLYNFIGLSDIGHSNSLTWDDGTDVVFTAFDGYTYEQLPSAEKCVGMAYTYGLQWYFVSCDNTEPFTCKKPKEEI